MGFEIWDLKISPVVFSDLEIRELLKAWAAISIAFAIASGGSGAVFNPRLLALSGLTVGIGFLIHEMGHKFVAQRFGYPAEFRAFNTMLILAVLLSLITRWVFAMPGAVFIGGIPSNEENGKISSAGPGSSILLATLFFLLLTILNPTKHSPTWELLNGGLRINSWWAFFNLLPIGNFDGPKIWRWNKGMYGAMIITAFLFSFVIG